jgi:hypothetical protein
VTLNALTFAVAWEEHGETIVWVAGVIVALGVIYRYIAKPFRIMVKFAQRVDHSLDAVEQQLLTNNGGSTLKDKIEATHRLAISLDERVTKLEKEKNP